MLWNRWDSKVSGGCPVSPGFQGRGHHLQNFHLWETGFFRFEVSSPELGIGQKPNSLLSFSVDDIFFWLPVWNINIYMFLPEHPKRFDATIHGVQAECLMKWRAQGWGGQWFSSWVVEGFSAFFGGKWYLLGKPRVKHGQPEGINAFSYVHWHCQVILT